MHGETKAIAWLVIYGHGFEKVKGISCVFTEHDEGFFGDGVIPAGQ